MTHLYTPSATDNKDRHGAIPSRTRGLSRIINRLRGKQPTTKIVHTEPPRLQLPPYLPEPRPRPLTPAQDECREALQPRAQNSSLLYSRLPFDVRHQILLHAFGNQTVHIDLNLAKEPLKHDQPHYYKFAHAGLSGNMGVLRRLHRRDDSPIVWRWFSCVCHRDSPRQDLRKLVAEDACLYGTAMCPLWPGDMPGKCQLGIMGWLLSCRQSYIETLPLLFYSNALHMSAAILLKDLPRLIVPAHLAYVRSLELTWPRYQSPRFSWREFLRLIDMVSESCPSLRSLTLVLPDASIDYTTDAQVFDQHLLQPLTDMFASSYRLSEILVELPTSSYTATQALWNDKYGKDQILEDKSTLPMFETFTRATGPRHGRLIVRSIPSTSQFSNH